MDMVTALVTTSC